MAGLKDMKTCQSWRIRLRPCLCLLEGRRIPRLKSAMPQSPSSSERRNGLYALLAVTVAWGWTFVWMKQALSQAQHWPTVNHSPSRSIKIIPSLNPRMP